MPEDQRPNPDLLLEITEREERRRKRGRLKIFFGAVAGVGKTYAMLEAARQLAIGGHRILVGYAEPHIRPDTERLLLGLDILPHLQVQYRGVALREFDIDAALKLRPEIILIDELAHTNAPGMRHTKRWQDVMELIEAGITVFTTLNAQHLESVNDLVARATGVRVQETLPDHVFESADEVQLVDIPPEQLLQRLADGKIYRGSGADAALANFFTLDNLMALRELALRLTADRIDRQRDERIVAVGGRENTSISERLLVCVGPSPTSADLIRAAARMAKMTHSSWTAVFVETPSLSVKDSSRRRLAEANLQLAEELGAKRVILQGHHAAREVAAYARKENVARIIAGKPAAAGWRRWVASSFTRELIQESGSIAIDLIREPPGPKLNLKPEVHAQSTTGKEVMIAAGVVLLITAVGVWLYHGLGLSNINVIMLYLVGVIWLSFRIGRTAGITGAILGVMAFDFTVVPPYYSFAVSDAQYILTFFVMLLAGLLISTVTTRLRQQEMLARQRQVRMGALLDMTQSIASAVELTGLAQSVERQMHQYFTAKCAVIVNEDGKCKLLNQSDGFAFNDRDQGVAEWVLRNGLPAGATTDTLPASECLVLPLKGVQGTVGVLALKRDNIGELTQTQTMDTLRAYCEQLAVAVDRLTFSAQTRRAWADAERESMRNTLLATVSHDLRTPLAAIAGAAVSLRDHGQTLKTDELHELATSIATEVDAMEHLIDKLLRMTRLEAGGLDMRSEIFPVEELVASAVERIHLHYPSLKLQFECTDHLPPLRGDPELMEQVLLNLLENAWQHGKSTTESPVLVTATRVGNFIDLSVRDHGPGLDPEDVPHLFEKFYRSKHNQHGRGMGLGLAICKTIVGLHGGQVEAIHHPEGGAEFKVRLPIATGSSRVTESELD